MPARLRFLIPIVTLVACASPPHAQVPQAADVAELWQEPTDLLDRDLFWGPGGAVTAPAPDATYQFIAFKRTGSNPGYDVRDPAGRDWSVKLGGGPTLTHGTCCHRSKTSRAMSTAVVGSPARGSPDLMGRLVASSKPSLITKPNDTEAGRVSGQFTMPDGTS